MPNAFVRLTLTLTSLLAVATAQADVVVVDKKDVTIELTTLRTKSIELQADDFEWSVPIDAMARIERIDDGKTFRFTTASGKDLKGTPKPGQKLDGDWDLGTYSASLSDLKSVDFGRPKPKAGSKPSDRPDGFVATCKSRDGTTLEGYSFSFDFAYSTQSRFSFNSIVSRDNPRWFIPLKYTQCVIVVPFEEVEKIAFTDLPREADGGWRPAVTILLRDKTTLSGELGDYGEDDRRFTGTTEYGTFSLDSRKVQEVVFHHDKDKAAVNRGLDQDIIPVGPARFDSPYTLALKTWDGLTIVLEHGFRFVLDDGYAWRGSETRFALRIGESKNVVAFDKIKNIVIQAKGKPEARLTTTSGKTVDVALEGISSSDCLGGNLEKLGPARISLAEVESIEIRPAGVRSEAPRQKKASDKPNQKSKNAAERSRTKSDGAAFKTSNRARKLSGPAIEEPYRLSASESETYPQALGLTAGFQSGNLIDAKTGNLLATDQEVQEVNRVVATIDTRVQEDRVRLVKEYIRIYGEERARRIGFTLYDSKGRAEHVWPALAPDKRPKDDR